MPNIISSLLRVEEFAYCEQLTREEKKRMTERERERERTGCPRKNLRAHSSRS